jgi:hypothetical protein
VTVTVPAVHTFEAAPLDRPTRLVTFAFVLTLFGAMTLVAMTEDPAVAPFTLGLAAVLTVAVYGLSPRRYEVGPGTLVVHRRLFGRAVHQLRDRGTRVPPVLGLGTFRLLGSGGAFGWFGTFWRRDLGRVRAAVTDRSRLVLVLTDRLPLLVSPRDPDALLRALEEVCP